MGNLMGKRETYKCSNGRVVVKTQPQLDKSSRHDPENNSRESGCVRDDHSSDHLPKPRARRHRLYHRNGVLYVLEKILLQTKKSAASNKEKSYVPIASMALDQKGCDRRTLILGQCQAY